jgi:hypothetical protein
MTTLTLRRIWSDKRENDWTVSWNDRSVARIFRDKSHHQERWIWSVHGFNVSQTDDMRGHTESFEEAKALAKPIVEQLIAEGKPLRHRGAEWKPGRIL